MDTKPSFEEAMARLEAITRQLEAGEISLEESLKKFDEGMQLVNLCSRQLDEARQKVTMLVEQNGDLQEVPFETQVVSEANDRVVSEANDRTEDGEPPCNP